MGAVTKAGWAGCTPYFCSRDAQEAHTAGNVSVTGRAV